MKVIVAIIRPERLEAVQTALKRLDLGFMTISEVLDGQERGHPEMYRGREVVRLARKLKLEFAVEDWALDDAVAAVSQAGRLSESGRSSGEKLFIMQLQECMPALGRAPVAVGDFAERTDGHRLTCR